MKKALQKLATSLVLITVMAFAARFAFAYYQTRQISSQVLRVVPFQTETGHIAYSLAAGKGFSSPFQRDTGPTAWLAPAYPALLALIFKLFGVYSLQSFYVAVLLNILFSAVTCVPIFYSGQRIAGPVAACSAAWLWALFPNAILIPFEWIWDTSLSALLAATLVCMTIKLSESTSMREWCLYGALWGLSALTNPALTLPFPLVFGWAAFRCGRLHKQRLVQQLLALAMVVVCCVPWTIRNYVRFHAFIPMRSNFPFELYVGNNENYADENRFRPGAVTQDREILRYFRMGETAFMEEEKRKALAFIFAHPRTEVRLIRLRVVDFWMGTATPLATFRSVDSWMLRAVLLCNYFAPVAAFIGTVVLILRRNACSFPLVSFAALFPTLYYVTHTSLRYRHPVDPVIMLLFASGIVEIVRWRVLRRMAASPEAEPSTAS